MNGYYSTSLGHAPAVQQQIPLKYDGFGTFCLIAFFVLVIFSLMDDGE